MTSYVVGLSVAGAMLPLVVALTSRDQALRHVGRTVLKFVVLMPAAATLVAVGLFQVLA